MSATGKLLEMIDDAASKVVKRQSPRVRLGTVKTVSAHSLGVMLDGDEAITPTARFCDASVESRVLVVADKTQYYALGVRR